MMIRRKLFYFLILFFVTNFVCFSLVYSFKPDVRTYMLTDSPQLWGVSVVDKQPVIISQLLPSYVKHFKSLLNLNWGNSLISGEKVFYLVKSAFKTSVLLLLPGFFLATFLALIFGLFLSVPSFRKSRMVVLGLSSLSSALVFPVVMLLFQFFFSSSKALNLFPVQGWDQSNFSNYLFYVTVPTFIIVFTSLGLSIPYYIRIFSAQMEQNYVKMAFAKGLPLPKILFKHVLSGGLPIILTRFFLSLPFVLLGGSFLLENYFNIPGIGLLFRQAMLSGDDPVLLHLSMLFTGLYITCLFLRDLLGPRVNR